MKYYLAAAAACAAMSAVAAALPPLEAYGELPSIRGLDISPTGNRFAYLSHENGGDYFMIAEPGKGVIAGGSTGDIKARDVFFVNDSYAIVIASETTSTNFFKGKWENSSAFSFDVEKKKFTTLLKGFDLLYPGQSGLGYIVGRAEGEDAVFMPAYIGEYGSIPKYGLLKAKLNLSSAQVVSDGTQNARDWFVDGDGTVLGRVDFDDKANQYRVFTGKSGALTKIYQEDSALPESSVVGINPDGSGLVLVSEKDDESLSLLSSLDFSGKITGPLFKRDDSSIERMISDKGRVVLGVQFSGMRPSYEFLDASLNADMSSIIATYPDDAVELVAWTNDKNKLLLQISGGATAPAYFMFDRQKRQIAKLAQRYDAIGDNDINQVVTIEYKARDDLRIPAVLTVPRGKQLGDLLPLIVIPHGGPEAYDAVGFDWMAQYFASRGYLGSGPINLVS